MGAAEKSRPRRHDPPRTSTLYLRPSDGQSSSRPIRLLLAGAVDRGRGDRL